MTKMRIYKLKQFWMVRWGSVEAKTKSFADALSHAARWRRTYFEMYGK